MNTRDELRAAAYTATQSRYAAERGEPAVVNAPERPARAEFHRTLIGDVQFVAARGDDEARDRLYFSVQTGAALISKHITSAEAEALISVLRRAMIDVAKMAAYEAATAHEARTERLARSLEAFVESP